jgi:5-methylcytosine-specific restriction endonuclease McrA
MPSTNPFSASCCIYACSVPVVSRGYCAKHSALREQTRALTADRHLGAQLYKTARWKRVRQQVLAKSALCECQECARLKRTRIAEVVHHIRHHGGDEQLFFDPLNLQALAKDCHDAITSRERRRT